MSRRRWDPLFVLAMGLAAGCGPRGTALRVEVDGPTSAPFDALARLDVTVVPSSENEAIPLAVAPEGGGTFDLPTSFVLLLADPRPGSVAVCVTTVTPAGDEIGSGCGNGTVERGRTTTVLVTILAPNCGDGVLQEPGEECDGAALAGESCITRGWAAGTLGCTTACTFDDTGCNDCGNGTVDAGEACDGTDLAGQSCTSQGLGGGTLACLPGCTFDVSGCDACGNGVVDGAEECDGGDLGGQTCQSLMMGFGSGTLACTTGCTFDTSGCALGCMDVAECDDMNPCTLEMCILNACTYSDWPTGTPCDDSLFCNGTDTCDAGVCVHAMDACPPASLGCDEAMQWCLCNDGNGCTINDRYSPSLICAGDWAENLPCGTGPTGEPLICCSGVCEFGNTDERCGSCGNSCTAPSTCCTGTSCC